MSFKSQKVHGIIYDAARVKSKCYREGIQISMRLLKQRSWRS